MDAAHVGGGAREREGLGITRDDLAHEVDLLERLLDLHGARLVGRDEHRPELPADHSAPQSRDIGVVMHGRLLETLAQVNRPALLALALGQGLGPVVVPVDQRRRLENARDPRLVVGRGRGGDNERQAEQRGERAGRSECHVLESPWAIRDAYRVLPARRRGGW